MCADPPEQRYEPGGRRFMGVMSAERGRFAGGMLNSSRSFSMEAGLVTGLSVALHCVMQFERIALESLLTSLW